MSVLTCVHVKERNREAETEEEMERRERRNLAQGQGSLRGLIPDIPDSHLISYKSYSTQDSDI